MLACSRIVLHYCTFLLESSRFSSWLSWMMRAPRNRPMADIPKTTMKAGMRKAHSREGNHACTGLDSSRMGCSKRI